MPSSKFVIESETSGTFRANKIKSMFDCDMDVVTKTFDVSIPIEDVDWNIGLIVGASGTGKTTIAKRMFQDYELFSGYEWSGDSFVDDFSEMLTAKQITEALSKVGFSSPPDWLKPFGVLSNGQKMRAELARLILEADKPFIYDEFTSVVDRLVARLGSSAIQKFIRKQGRKFVAVSCHYDIEEWLEPDWVFNCDDMQFSRRCLRRPEIRATIRKAKQREWAEFMEHHYLTHSHNNAAHKYICEIDGRSVAWCSVIHFPHPIVKDMKRIHRIVVKPDYQGIGVGAAFMDAIADSYKQKGYRMSLVTSSPAFVLGLQKNPTWAMTRKPSRLAQPKTGDLKASASSARLTASFEYVGARHG